MQIFSVFVINISKTQNVDIHYCFEIQNARYCPFGQIKTIDLKLNLIKNGNIKGTRKMLCKHYELNYGICLNREH